MVRACVFPNCTNKMSKNSARSFHRLPLLDEDVLKSWLVVLQMDPNTPVHKLRLADHRVCSDHFSQDDYCQSKRRKNPKHIFLKKTAVPKEEIPAADRVEVISLAEVIILTQHNVTHESMQNKGKTK